MALSSTTRTGQAGVQTYLIGFTYLKPTFVRVFVDDVETTDFTFSSDGLSVVIGTPAIAGGEVIDLVRTTDMEDDERIVDFETGAALTEQNLDTSDLQQWHKIQELAESIVSEGAGGHVGDTTIHLPTTGTHGDVLTWDADDEPVLVTPGTSGQVLTTAGPGALPAWQTPPGASGGEANTGSNANTGGGVGVFRVKNALDLEFRGILGASGSGIAAALNAGTQEIQLTISPTGITEEATPASGDLLLGFVAGALRTFDVGNLPGSSGEVNTASNSGTAGIGVWARKTGVDLEFKNLVGGTGVTLSEASDDITIALTAGGVGNTTQADMPAWSIKARNAGTTGDPQDVTDGDLTIEGSPESGDYLLGFLNTGELRRFDASNFLGGGGGGSITGGSNLPGGQGIFAGVTGTNTLDFRSLVAGSGIVVTADANTVTITTTGIGGDITGGANVNSTGIGVYDSELNGILQFRGLTVEAGSGLTVAFDDADNEITFGTADGGLALSKLTAITSMTLVGNPTTGTAVPIEFDVTALASDAPTSGTELIGWSSNTSGASLRRYDVGGLPLSGWIANNNLADMSAWSIKARNSSSTGTPQDVTSGNLTAAAPVSGDFLLGFLSSGELRRFDVGDLPGGSGTDADAIHDNVAGEIDAIAEDSTPAIADLIITEDASASYAKKSAQLGNLPETVTAFKTRIFATGYLLDVDLATPPGSPADGDTYVVGTSATGAWTGQDGNLAAYRGATSAWVFFAPQAGPKFKVAENATSHWKTATITYSTVESLWHPIQAHWSSTIHWTGEYFMGGTEKKYAKCFSGVLGTTPATNITHGVTIDYTYPPMAWGPVVAATNVGTFVPQDASTVLLTCKVGTSSITIDHPSQSNGKPYQIRLECAI